MNKIQALYRRESVASYFELFSDEQPPIDSHVLVASDLMVEPAGPEYSSASTNIGCVMLYGPGKAIRETNMRIAPEWQGKQLATVALERLLVEELTQESTLQAIGFSSLLPNPAVTAIAYKFGAQEAELTASGVNLYVSRERVEHVIRDQWSVL